MRACGQIALLLVILMLVTVAIGNCNAVQHTDAIVRRIQSLGGEVHLEINEATRVRPLYKRPTLWQSMLGCEANVTKIEVKDAQNTPLRDLFCIKAFPKIRELIISNAEATPDVLDEIARAPNLVWLELESCTIEDVWLQPFENVTNFQGVVLNGNPIGNRVIDYFQECHGLKYFGLKGTRVTEARIKEYWEDTAPADCIISYRNAFGMPALLDPSMRVH